MANTTSKPQSADNKPDLSTFKKSIDRMIATSDTSYNNKSGFRKGINIQPFTREEVESAIANMDTDDLREVSNFFFYASGFYRRTLINYATLLKYVYLLVPHITSENGAIEDPKTFSKYRRALEFMSKLGLKSLSKHFAIRVLVDGAYYGILRDFGKDGLAVQDLPASYCRSRFKNQAGVPIVEMKVSYFDKIRDKKTRDEVLNSFPKELKRGYLDFHNKNGSEWIALAAGTGIYLKLFDERPFFGSILPAIIDFGDYRKFEKEKDQQDLKALLVQQLPLDKDSELVFEPEEAEEIHRGSVEMLKNNKNMDVLTTYADVSLEDMESNRSVVADNLEKIERSIYSEAGVSKQLFNAEGNVALKASLNNDASLMLVLAEQIAIWVQYLVNQRYGNSGVIFNIRSLPISNQNETDMRKDALSFAQSGYSFILPLLTFDLEQGDLTDLKNLEINALKLNQIMIPLASSFTTSSGDPNLMNGDQNKVDDLNKSDKTIINKQSE